MQEKQEMQQLQIQREIGKTEGDLIEDAVSLIDDKEPFNSMEESQLRNVLDVASAANSVDVIDVYIKYQIGRSNQNAKWRHNDFGESLIKQINKFLKDKAENIANSCDAGDKKEEIWLKLTRLYLGHLNRYFVYKKR